MKYTGTHGKIWKKAGWTEPGKKEQFMKRSLCLWVLLAISCFGTLPLRAAPFDAVVGVLIQSEPQVFPDQGPVMQDGRVLVPIRPVLECGYVQTKVHWDPETQTVSVFDQRGGCIRMTVGSCRCEITDGQGNIKERMLDSAPLLIGGRVLLPLRVLMEALEFYVVWQPTTQCVEIIDSMPAWRRLLPLADWKKELDLLKQASSGKGVCLPCLAR